MKWKIIKHIDFLILVMKKTLYWLRVNESVSLSTHFRYLLLS